MDIEMAFFPANTFNILQQMELSVKKSLKGHYEKKILMEIIEPDGNMLVTVNFLIKAWEEVTEETLRNAELRSSFANAEEVVE